MKRILKYKELKTFLEKKLNFQFKRQSGSHKMYEGLFKGKVRNVTLDDGYNKFTPRTQKNIFSSMIKQMGFKNKKEFFKYYYKSG